MARQEPIKAQGLPATVLVMPPSHIMGTGHEARIVIAALS